MINNENSNDSTTRINDKVTKEVNDLNEKNKEDNLNQNDSTKQYNIQEKPKPKYTPLRQDAKPYDYTKIKKKKNTVTQEINNQNEMNFSNKNNAIDSKRNNFVKKMNYVSESPLFSYFNDSQKYLSEQYSSNVSNNNIKQLN